MTYVLWSSQRLLLTLEVQDEAALTKAGHTIEDSDAKMEQTKKELEKHEAELAQAEKVLEEIRDSLKGLFKYLQTVMAKAHRLCAYRQDTSLPRSDRGQAEGAPALDGKDQL